MRNVSGYLFLLSLPLLFTGCKQPELEVSSLGKMLPAPSLKGANPLEQENDGYGLIEGNCDPRISSLFISFDKQLWAVPKKNPDVTGSGLSAVVNDIDCSDGNFKVYLTKADLLSQWNIDLDDDNDVEAIYVKGATGIGDTATLEIRKSQNTDNPTKIVLQKNFLPGFSGSGTCAEFSLSAQTSQGYTRPLGSAVTVGLRLKTPTTAYSPINFYNDADCATPAISSIVMPANTSYIRLFYRFSDEHIDVEKGFKFLPVITAGSLIADTTPQEVTLRDASRSFLQLFSVGGMSLANRCIEITASFQSYGGYYSSIYTDTITISSSDSNLKYYGTDNTCSTIASSNSFSYNTNDRTFYVKYTSTTNTQQPFISAKLTATPSVSADFFPWNHTFDRSNKTEVKKLDFWIYEHTQRGSCLPGTLVSTNENRTPVKATMNMTAFLSSNKQGDYWDNQDCIGSPISEVVIAANEGSKTIYYRPTESTATKHTLKAEFEGLTNSAVTRDVAVKNQPTHIKLSLKIMDTTLGNGYLSTINNQCEKIERKFSLVDSLGDISHANKFGQDLQLSMYTSYPSPNDIHFYLSKQECEDQINRNYSPNTILAQNSSETTDYLYIRVPYITGAINFTGAYSIATPGINLAPGQTDLNVYMP